MSLDFRPGDRRRLVVTPTASIDLTDCVIWLIIDDITYGCTWTGAAVETTPGSWTRPAVTDDWFAGPTVPADKIAGAIVLTTGTHTPRVIVEHPSGTRIDAELPQFRIATT